VKRKGGAKKMAYFNQKQICRNESKTLV